MVPRLSGPLAVSGLSGELPAPARTLPPLLPESGRAAAPPAQPPPLSTTPARRKAVHTRRYAGCWPPVNGRALGSGIAAGPGPRSGPYTIHGEYANIAAGPGPSGNCVRCSGFVSRRGDGRPVGGLIRRRGARSTLMVTLAEWGSGLPARDWRAARHGRASCWQPGRASRWDCCRKRRLSARLGRLLSTRWATCYLLPVVDRDGGFLHGIAAGNLLLSTAAGAYAGRACVPSMRWVDAWRLVSRTTCSASHLGRRARVASLAATMHAGATAVCWVWIGRCHPDCRSGHPWPWRGGSSRRNPILVDAAGGIIAHGVGARSLISPTAFIPTSPPTAHGR